MLPRYTYILRFFHRDSSEIEDFEHSDRAYAFEHFELFDASDEDIYRELDLIEYDHDTATEKLLAVKQWKTEQDGEAQ